MTVGKRLFARWLRYALCLLPLLLALGCSGPPELAAPERLPSEDFPGGVGSVKYKPFASFELPASNLAAALLPAFHAGKALANQPWIKAPTATDSRDGLGPLYNGRTCLGCHINGGRGLVPLADDQAIFASIVRISLPGEDVILGAQPDPVYGDQMQVQSIALSHQLRGKVQAKTPEENPEAPPEARIYVDWHVKGMTYPDGTTIELRYPTARIEELGYGQLSSNILISLRAAPAIHGVGLLEAIDQRDVEALSDPIDRNEDGISGRVNRVWDFEQQKTVAGRFGWKANRANLPITTASAFQGDLGITNPLFPEQPCSSEQQRCLSAPSGNDRDGFELPEHLLQLTVGFIRGTGVPVSRPQNKQTTQGRALFYHSGCAQCHQPSFTTGSMGGELAHLGGQTIWPYTDLLLHDMGSDLADGRPDYEASGREWRTPPLWGIGLSSAVNGVETLLHDGRARNVEEAIVWHGGEAATARQRFVELTAHQRLALIAFVETL